LWVARLLLDNVNFLEAENRVILVIDRSKSKPQIEEFNSYIRRQLEAKIDPKIPLEIRHVDSNTDGGLNVVDLFSWGIFRKYERKDVEWYEIYRKNTIRYSLFAIKKERALRILLLKLLPTRWKGTLQQSTMDLPLINYHIPKISFVKCFPDKLYGMFQITVEIC